MSKPPGTNPDLTASDVLAPQFWTGKTERPAPGFEAACTRIAIDLQNLDRDTAEECIRRSLETLRDAASADAAFAVFLDADGEHVQSVQCARGPFAQCQPEALRGTPTKALPWVNARFEHLRLSEFRDTASPRKEQAEDAGTLAELAIGSALLVSFRIGNLPAGLLGLAYGLPRGGFDANLQSLMKLLGSSLATGIERQRLSQELGRIEERNALAEFAANDGLWDFDVEGNDVYFSPRWRAMLGYEEADLKGGFDWRSLVHPDDLSRVQSAIRDHVAAKTPIFESVHRMRHRDGEWRWVISRAKAQLDAHGRLLRLVGVELDITERKMYEEALFREKESA